MQIFRPNRYDLFGSVGLNLDGSDWTGERESVVGEIGGGAPAGLVRTSPEFVDTMILAINGHGKTTGRERG